MATADSILAPYGDEPSRKRGPIGDPSASALLLTDKWQGADKAALAKAIEAEAAGMDRDEIWRRFLWGRGVGTDDKGKGAWLTESSPMTLSSKVLRDIAQGSRTKLPQSPDEIADMRARRARAGYLDDPEFYSQATFPDEDVSRGDPTAQLPGRPGVTRFETLGAGAFGNYEPDKTGLGLGTYLGSNLDKNTKSVGIGEPRFPFRGIPLKTIMRTWRHEKGHEADDRGGILGPEPDFPGATMMHRYLARENRPEAGSLREDTTTAERRALHPRHSYPVPEELQIYFDPQTKRWVIPDAVLSDPLGKFIHPAPEENWDVPARQERADLLDRVYGR